ncbi:MAG: sulfotransferase [Xenococcaceae cyanobacterium MO_188.B29]|nr:sulfotransferase [Xenococcaceae cyanobacterium MO_188.B29]
MKFDSVLIITYGRSGSTLLQGILNSIEGCLIRGENDNFCFALYQAYQSLKNSKKFRKATEATHSWYGAPFINEEAFLEQASQMTKDLILANKKDDPTIRCYGFKEIRYIQLEVQNKFEDYLKFLGKIFPNVCFIFNTRNLDDVLESGWWSKTNKIKSKEKLVNLEKKFAEYCSKHNNTFQITYENIISKSNTLEAMFDFLGVEYAANKIDKSISIKHSHNFNQKIYETKK